MSDTIISTSFCGGNADITIINEREIKIQPDLRGTTIQWFYWAFSAEVKEACTLTFHVPYLGYFGAAVSHDLMNWEWTNTANEDRSAFTYTFNENEGRVYFAHDMLYHPSQFHHFCEKNGLRINTLCIDRFGTPVPYVQLGGGEKHILLTARHHCCESTGNYVMEGMLQEYIDNPEPELTITAVPFVDADGVVNGDQGKERSPHDHNRDYLEGIYPAVREIKKYSLSQKGNLLCVFDLHSPWHIGGKNDKVLIVRNSCERYDDYVHYGELFEENMTTGAFQYKTVNDVNPGEEWNVYNEPVQCATWHEKLPGVLLSNTLETPYFGEAGNVVSQNSLREMGRCHMRAVLKFLKEKKQLHSYVPKKLDK